MYNMVVNYTRVMGNFFKASQTKECAAVTCGLAKMADYQINDEALRIEQEKEWQQHQQKLAEAKANARKRQESIINDVQCDLLKTMINRYITHPPKEFKDVTDSDARHHISDVKKIVKSLKPGIRFDTFNQDQLDIMMMIFLMESEQLKGT